MVSSTSVARALLESGVAEFFVTDMEAPDGDVLDLLWLLTSNLKGPRRTFVVTPRRDPWLHFALRKLPVSGVLDSTSDGVESLAVALDEVVAGRRFRSVAGQQASDDADMRLRPLSRSERVVFAAISDGRDTGAVADLLGQRKRAVEWTLAELRRKLDVPSFARLATLSARFGFVRSVGLDVIRVGFGMLLADYFANSQRPTPPSEELCMLYPEATRIATGSHPSARL